MSEPVPAQVLLRDPHKRSLIGSDEPVTSENVDEYTADSAVAQHVRDALQGLGFEVTGFGPGTLSVTGDKDLWEAVFGVRLRLREQAAKFAAPSYESPVPARIPPALADWIAGIAFPKPPELFP